MNRRTKSEYGYPLPSCESFAGKMFLRDYKLIHDLNARSLRLLKTQSRKVAKGNRQVSGFITKSLHFSAFLAPLRSMLFCGR
jgi:hypothetical protein